MSLCNYGCGQESKFKTSNGRRCCSDNWRKCPAVRKKNSEGLKRAHKEGKLPSDFGGKQGWRKGLTALTDSRIKSKYSNLDELFSKNTVSGEYIRRALIDLNILDYTCSICSIDEWLGKPIVLDLDHIDGDRHNNEISNLRFLCPNCHSQTSTFRGKNKSKRNKSVSDELLLDALNKTSSIRQALIIVGMAPKGGNYVRAKRLLAESE